MKTRLSLCLQASLLQLRSIPVALLIFAFCFAAGCRGRNEPNEATIEFTKVPEAREGGPESVSSIEGRVTGARPDDKIVLFAKSGQWWIQPLTDEPFTIIRQDSTWSSSTHFGTEYAALLVGPSYHPPMTIASLPVKGGAVKAVTVIKGLPTPPYLIKTIHFNGYDWRVRSASSNRGGGVSLYGIANAWTDKSGALHLRIAMDTGKWHSAEVNLIRSLGYGTYRFSVRDSSFLEPAAVLSMFTWDDSAPEQNHREFGVEITRWGDPHNKNAQFVVQPYYVPANVARFVVPSGRITYSIRWQPESISFRALQGEGTAKPRIIAEHSFTAGIPSPGNESIHMNLYLFSSSQIPLKKETEVVIEKFEYLP